MRVHLSTILHTRWRLTLLTLVLLMAIASFVNGSVNDLFDGHPEATLANAATAGISIILLVSVWSAGDLNNQIGVYLLFKDGDRAKFTLRRIAATLVLCSALTVVFYLSSVINFPPQGARDWISFIPMWIAVAAYGLLALMVAFITRNGIATFVISLFLVLGFEPTLSFFGLPAGLASSLTLETYISAMFGEGISIFSTLIVLFLGIALIALTFWRGKRIRL